MKRSLLLFGVLVAGVATGGSTALGVQAWAVRSEVKPATADEREADQEATVFVPSGPILTPLVFPDGSLGGYASIEVQLEVPESQAETVKQRLPLLLHAINLRTYRVPLAAGPDGTLPDLSRFRGLVVGAAPTIFGPGVVRQAAITQARPA